ncbi:MAG: AI-2E family transporter [Lachnospiraceae bacterium]|nr:AI-2E family transporter [Lachnospiraceae bacterium]
MISDPDSRQQDESSREPDGSPREADDPSREAKTGGRGSLNIRPYLAVALTAVLVIFVSLLLFFFLFRFDGFSNGVGSILNSLQGIIIGLILAYLLNPVMKFFERGIRRRLSARESRVRQRSRTHTREPAQTQGRMQMQEPAQDQTIHDRTQAQDWAHTRIRTRKRDRTVRGLAVACTMVVFLAVVVVLLMMIVPQLVVSIQELISTMSEKLEALTDWINRLMRNTRLAGQMENLAEQIFEWIEEWLQTNIQNRGGEIMTALYEGVYSAVKLVFNIFVGLIVAVYVLMTKERFVGQSKKLVYAIFKPRTGNAVMEVLHRANEVFGGFFIGKIIDSLIIGCICFTAMYIMKLPYAVLVSVIIGVTNIIPVFGPFIGAIPSVILIFLVNPIQALYFLILIVVLQQVDGNIIGPKILGNSTGLSPFWVMFAILLFGGSFSVAGMIFGVPVFALIYYIIKRVAEYFLGRKHLPRDTMAYVRLERVDVSANRIIEHVSRSPKMRQPRSCFRKPKEKDGEDS